MAGRRAAAAGEPRAPASRRPPARLRPASRLSASPAAAPVRPSIAPPLVVVVLKGYPRVSETFIAHELAALERRGLPLHIVSLRRPYDRLTHPVHATIRAPVTYLPEYLHEAPGRVLAGHARALARAPRRYLAGAPPVAPRRPCAIRRRTAAGASARPACSPPSCRPAPAHLHAHFLHTPASVARYAAAMSGLEYSLAGHAKDVWTTPDWELRAKLAEARFTVTCTAAGRARLDALAPGRVELVYHGLDRRLFAPPPAFGSRRDGTDPRRSGAAPGRRPLPAQEGVRDPLRGGGAGAGRDPAHRGGLRPPRGRPPRPCRGARPGESGHLGGRPRSAGGPGTVPRERSPPPRLRGRARRRPRRLAERRRRGALPGIAGRRHARRGDPRAGGGRPPRPARPAGGRRRVRRGDRAPGAAIPRRGAGWARRASRAWPTAGTSTPGPTGSTGSSGRPCRARPKPPPRPRSPRACRRDAARLLHARQAPVPDGALRRPRARASPDGRVPRRRLRAAPGEPAPHLPARVRRGGRRPRRAYRRPHGRRGWSPGTAGESPRGGRGRGSPTRATTAPRTSSARPSRRRSTFPTSWSTPTSRRRAAGRRSGRGSAPRGWRSAAPISSS